jgi:uncharacterized protein DUF2505
MPSFHLEHDLECSENTYWDKAFFDEEYNRRLFNEELRFPEWRVLDQKDEGPRIVRNIRAQPPVDDVPGPLKSVVGDGAGYAERGTYDRAAHSYEANITPNRMADRIAVRIVTRTTKLDDTRCRRIVDGTVTAKIFVVGALLEQRMIADLKRSFEKSAVFTNRFVAEKGWV